MRTLICAANPKSRNGKVGASLAHLEATITKLSATPLILDLTTPGFTDKLLDAIGNATDPVLMGVGGDGTHYSLINTMIALRESGDIEPFPYALCPMGTGNDIAKSIGLRPGPDRFDEAVYTALHGRLEAVDLGKTTSGVFADMLSAGIDVDVLASREKLATELRNYPLLNRCVHGYLIYALASLNMVKSKKLEIALEIDGKTVFTGKTAGVLINNCAVHAGEFLLTPGASMTDGMLDIRVFSGRIRYAWSFVRGWRHLPEILREGDVDKQFKGRHIKLTSPTRFPIQVDGELADDTDTLTVSVIPSAIELCIPKNGGLQL